MDIKECVINYIKSLSSEDRKKVKTMLDHDIICCLGYSREHNIDPVLFNQELKSVLGGK